MEGVEGDCYWGLWCQDGLEAELGRILLIPMLHGLTRAELESSKSPCLLTVPSSSEPAGFQGAAIKLLLDLNFVITGS